MDGYFQKPIPYISNNLFKVLVILLAVGMGAIIRHPYLIKGDTFPAGDGGLFVEMIYAIKSNHYLLPNYVNYNSHQIPFAYPPLGFYLALISSKILGMPTLQVVQILPVVINLITIGCFVLLASELSLDRVEVLISSGIFSLVFQAYQWTIKGGGLSRSPGFLFTVLALYFLLLYRRKDDRLYLVLAMFSLGFTLMSHLEWALIAAASVSIFVLFLGIYKSRRQVYDLVILGLGSALVALPWWGLVVYRFGLTPFLSAWNVAEMEPGQFIEKFLAGSMFSINILSSSDYFLFLFGMMGFVFSIFYRRNLLLPAWLLITYVVAPKNSPISGLLPLVMLMAVGLRNLDRVSFYWFSRMEHAIKDAWRPVAGKLSRFPFSILYLFVIIFFSVPRLVDRPMLQTIKPIERSAMEFVEKNTSADARFIVLTPMDWYSADQAEWFPYLAKRQSLTTPQGLEWVSADKFNEIASQVAMLSQLVRYEQSGVETGRLADYVEINFGDHEFVAIFANRLEKEFGGFLKTGRYETFYFKRNVLILQRISSQ